MPKKKFQNIQIFRIVACIGTFLIHFGQRMEIGGILRRITDLGGYGVSVFFIISGFVAWNSVDNNKEFSVREYWIKRCVKILPIYYVKDKNRSQGKARYITISLYAVYGTAGMRGYVC